MTTVVYRFTSLTTVYSIVYSDADQRKHQSSASLAFAWGIHRSPVNSPHKGPVTRKMLSFDDVIMIAAISADDDCIPWKNFAYYWLFVRGIDRWPVDPHKKWPLMRSFDVFFDINLNKLWKKHSGCIWFETAWRSCDIVVMRWQSFSGGILMLPKITFNTTTVRLFRCVTINWCLVTHICLSCVSIGSGNCLGELVTWDNVKESLIWRPGTNCSNTVTIESEDKNFAWKCRLPHRSVWAGDESGFPSCDEFQET